MVMVFRFRGIIIRDFYNWLYGRCFVINALPDKLKSFKTGPRFGLRLAVDIHQDEYVATHGMAGVRITIHDPKVVPFPEDDGISVGPGQSATIGLRMVSMNWGCTVGATIIRTPIVFPCKHVMQK